MIDPQKVSLFLIFFNFFSNDIANIFSTKTRISTIPKLSSPKPICNSSKCAQNKMPTTKGLSLIRPSNLNCSQNSCEDKNGNGNLLNPDCSKHNVVGYRKADFNTHAHLNSSEDVARNGVLYCNRKICGQHKNNSNIKNCDKNTLNKLNVSECIQNLSISGSGIEEEILEHKDLASHNTRQASQIPGVSIREMADDSHYQIHCNPLFVFKFPKNYFLSN